MFLARITDASEDVLTLAEVKAHLRVTSDAEDALIGNLVKAAQDYLRGPEGRLGRALASETWEMRCKPVARYEARFPMPDATALVQVSYLDADGAEQIATLSDFRYYGGHTGTYVEPVVGKSWPTALDREDALRLRLTVGYGAASAVPYDIKQALLLLVAHWFENRELMGTGKEMPMAVESVISKYAVRWAG